MLNSESNNTFCTVPWFEVHINADGSYHTCGMQHNWISGTDLAKEYNVQVLNIADWMSSKFMYTDRYNKLAGIKDLHCNSCYATECGGGSSKRVRENLKSKIHNRKKVFPLTFAHSPDRVVLTNPTLSTVNIRSFHLSLGNECNLYCRTCDPSYSSRIAFMEKANPVRLNWTDNNQAWDHVVDSIVSAPDLQFVHIIGGEPMLTPRFEELIDALIAAGKTDTYFGFCTNGTIYREELFAKLQQFRHVDVGISMESTTILNDFIRAGSSTQDVIANIKKIQKFQAENYYVTLRPVISALSVHTYDQTLQWALDNNLGILSNTLDQPGNMQVHQLPSDVKTRLINKFSAWPYSNLMDIHTNGREPEHQKLQADNEMRSVINMLHQPNDPAVTDALYAKLQGWNWFKTEEIRNYFYLD